VGAIREIGNVASDTNTKGTGNAVYPTK